MAKILRGVSEACITDTFSFHDEERVERTRKRYMERSNLSDAFRDRVGKVHDRIRTSYAYRIATAASRKLRNVGREDRAEQLYRIDQLQHARRTMREGIMSSPIVRQARARRMIDGFSDDYKWRDTMINDHSELVYRQINNGLMQAENGKNYATTYWMDKEDAKRFTDFDRGEILLTRRHVERLILKGEGEDPTSKYNACLTGFYP